MNNSKITLEDLFNLLNSVPSADRNSVIDTAYAAVKFKIEELVQNYNQVYAFYRQLTSFSILTGECFKIVTPDVVDFNFVSQEIKNTVSEKNVVPLTNSETKTETETGNVDNNVDYGDADHQENNEDAIPEGVEEPEEDDGVNDGANKEVSGNSESEPNKIEDDKIFDDDVDNDDKEPNNEGSASDDSVLNSELDKKLAQIKHNIEELTNPEQKLVMLNNVLSIVLANKDNNQNKQNDDVIHTGDRKRPKAEL